MKRFRPASSRKLREDVFFSSNNAQETPVFSRFFVKDSLKDGGAYKKYTGKVRKIDSIERTIVFLDANGQSRGKAIQIDNVTELYCDLTP